MYDDDKETLVLFGMRCKATCQEANDLTSELYRLPEYSEWDQIDTIISETTFTADSILGAHSGRSIRDMFDRLTYLRVFLAGWVKGQIDKRELA